MPICDVLKKGDTVYICSPFSAETREEIEHNVAVARKACELFAKAGVRPVATHLYYPQFMNDKDPNARLQALAWAEEALKNCRYLIVLGDRVSEGMALEISYAIQANIPVIWEKYDLIKFKREENECYTMA